MIVAHTSTNFNIFVYPRIAFSKVGLSKPGYLTSMVLGKLEQDNSMVTS